MIFIRFKIDTPLWKTWREDCKAATEKICRQADAGKEIKVSAIYKRDSIRKDVYFAKTGPFRGKCAYCESYITDFQSPDIEHFRPKGAIKDKDGNLVDHPGYYWLAYDDTNLLPSCEFCNQPKTLESGKKAGKHYHFPIKGEYVTRKPRTPYDQPPDLSQEQPLLLNPIDWDPERNPEKHLGVELSNGVMVAKTEEGQRCIDVFGLNNRDQLLPNRVKTISHFKGLVSQFMHNPSTRPDTLKQMKDILDGAESYTLASRTAAHELMPLADLLAGHRAPDPDPETGEGL